MQDNMVYTPQAHIPIACVSAEDGVIYVKFKKNHSDLYETITLDQLIFFIVNVISKTSPEEITERPYYE